MATPPAKQKQKTNKQKQKQKKPKKKKKKNYPFRHETYNYICIHLLENTTKSAIAHKLCNMIKRFICALHIATMFSMRCSLNCFVSLFSFVVVPNSHACYWHNGPFSLTYNNKTTHFKVHCSRASGDPRQSKTIMQLNPLEP